MLVAFAACTKREIKPVDQDDLFEVFVDGNDSNRGRDIISGHSENNDGGGIVDPDEDDDDLSDDANDGIVDPDEDDDDLDDDGK